MLISKESYIQKLTEENGESRFSAVPRNMIGVSGFCYANDIGKTTFYSEVKAGRIKIVKVGSRTLIPWSELTAWPERLQNASSDREGSRRNAVLDMAAGHE